MNPRSVSKKDMRERRAAEELVFNSDTVNAHVHPEGEYNVHVLTSGALFVALYLDEQHSTVKSPAWENVWVHGREGGESYLFSGSFKAP